MKPARRLQPGRPALDLIEEAVHLLRTAPVAALASYYVGSLSFVLGGLYFWADMSHSPFARQRVVEAALGVSVLFVWMKFWQAQFARRLRAHLTGETLPPLGLRRGAHILFTQTALAPTGLFLLPLAALPVLPLPAVYAFYQNLTVLVDGDTPGLRAALRKAARLAGHCPRQNVLALLYLSAFGLFVFLNSTILCAALPTLLQSLLGFETVFSRGGQALLNTTFFATMFGVTFLCLDPILKAMYVLRGFYGESVQSGADLRVELRRLAAPAGRAAAGFLLGLTLAGATPACAAGDAPAPAVVSQSIAPAELDRAIDEVLRQRKYAWRMPRENPAGQEGLLSSFVHRIGQMIRGAVRGTLEWLEKILGKIFGRINFAPAGFDATRVSQMLLFGLLAAVISTAAILLYRMRRNRRRQPQFLHTEAIRPAPDLTDENVSADQLPEDGWTRLARELAERGEFRLALRAYYLASLAHLAERNLILLARFKSNHDYELELGRRAHSFPNLLQVFGENVGAFDRVWYGTHDASGELVKQFAANVDCLKTAG